MMNYKHFVSSRCAVALAVSLLSLACGASALANADTSSSYNAAILKEGDDASLSPAMWTRFYVEPKAPFVMVPDSETVEKITFSNESLETINARLKELRAASADTILSIRITGKLTVKDVPFTPVSKSLITFQKGSSISAVPGATADALISIKDKEFISISSDSSLLLLDGKGLVETGLLVRGAGRIHLNHLYVKNVVANGIDYKGRGISVFADGGSISRCRIEECGADGLVIADLNHFCLVDNVIRGNQGNGIHSQGNYGTLVNNACRGNGKNGIRFSGTNNTISRNAVTDNKQSGVEAGSDASKSLITYNTMDGNQCGVTMLGKDVKSYYNTMGENQKQFNLQGKANQMVGNIGVRAQDGTIAEGNLFFYPPTANDRHAYPVIVPGMGRKDFTIRGGKGRNAVSLNDVSDKLHELRKAHSDDYIVATLQGDFYAGDKKKGMDMPAATAIILDGTITATGDVIDYRTYPNDDWKTRRATMIIKMKRDYLSFSGGTINGHNKPYHGIWTDRGNVAVIDSVNMVEGGFNGITTRGKRTPLFIRNLKNVGTENRGIWMITCSNVHILDSYFRGMVADGVDVDAHTNDSTVMFCRMFDNKRCGIFLEIGSSRNALVANRHENNGTAIAYFSAAVAWMNENTAAFNHVTEVVPKKKYDWRISVRSHAANNFIFNNRMQGIDTAHGPAHDNYWCQNLIFGDRSSIRTFTPKNVHFNSK